METTTSIEGKVGLDVNLKMLSSLLPNEILSQNQSPLQSIFKFAKVMKILINMNSDRVRQIFSQNKNQDRLSLQVEQSASNNANYQFYQEYSKLISGSYQIAAQLVQLQRARDELFNKLGKLESRSEKEFKDKFRKLPYEKRQKGRRPSYKIKRNFECEVPECSKRYQSQGSMLQHMKLKHSEEYQQRSKRRERLIIPSLNEEINSTS